MPVTIEHNKTINYQVAVEWDVLTWGRSLHFWESIIDRQQLSMEVGLELGSRHGGLSYFFAKRYEARMFCSDYHFPSEKARELHESNGLQDLISYHDVDATQIPFDDHTFDFVVFKSMLGAVGARNHPEKQAQALAEIHRVLKPGGTLFFAENLKASPLHAYARQRFIPWGNSWYYISLQEMKELLQVFSKKEIHTTGFSAAFVPKPAWLKNIVSQLDNWLFFIPKSWKYVVYGYAKK